MSQPAVVVLSYGSGNVRSAVRALERVGAQVTLTADPAAVENADGLLVPGVGAFASVMDQLRAVDAPRLIERRLAGGRPVLGICVGMQVMFEASTEYAEADDAGAATACVAEVGDGEAASPAGTELDGQARPASSSLSSFSGASVGEFAGQSTGVGQLTTAGLAQWPGTVRRLNAPVVPHMGWSLVRPPAGTVLFRGVEGERFYFVHSYAATTAPEDLLDDGPTRLPASTWATHGEDFVAAVENGALMATQFHPEKSGDAGAELLRNWLATL